MSVEHKKLDWAANQGENVIKKLWKNPLQHVMTLLFLSLEDIFFNKVFISL